MPTYDDSGRLTEAAFLRRYGPVKAWSATASRAGCFVNTATLRNGEHVTYDWRTGQYVKVGR